MKQRAYPQYLALAAAVLLSLGIYLNQQAIRDWWVLRSYQPSAEVMALADAAGLSDDGRHLFYVSQPQINDRQSFNQHCTFTEKSLVLGCYAGSIIYVFNVDNSQLDGIEEVTAAHELLHAAYSRLGSAARERIDQLASQALAELDDARVTELIDGYRQDDSLSVANELHSILGSEVRGLPPDLEAYYSQYFSDRLAVVALAEDYEAVFTKLRARLDDLRQTITELKDRIAASEQRLTADKSALDAEAERLNGLRQNGQIAQYNAGVPAFNADVNAYNSLIETYKGQVAKHNQAVEQYNGIALEQNQLVQSIDSQFQPID